MTAAEYAMLYWHAHQQHLDCKRAAEYDASEIADLLSAAHTLARCPIASIRKAAARNLPVVVVAR
ncbi:MAG: hypothetical protein ACK5XN_18875 [Bacteroidota bacterium]